MTLMVILFLLAVSSYVSMLVTFPFMAAAVGTESFIDYVFLMFLEFAAGCAFLALSAFRRKAK